jgi:hypothetical protein
MAREFRILHHRQSLHGGHWDLVENLIPFRSATANAPHGEGTLCAALEAAAADGWLPVMDLVHTQTQPGESFILLARGV